MEESRDAGEAMAKLTGLGLLLQGHKGEEFFHRAYAKKAKSKKRKARRAGKASKRRNRGR